MQWIATERNLYARQSSPAGCVEPAHIGVDRSRPTSVTRQSRMRRESQHAEPAHDAAGNPTSTATRATVIQKAAEGCLRSVMDFWRFSSRSLLQLVKRYPPCIPHASCFDDHRSAGPGHPDPELGLPERP